MRLVLCYAFPLWVTCDIEPSHKRWQGQYYLPWKTSQDVDSWDVSQNMLCSSHAWPFHILSTWSFLFFIMEHETVHKFSHHFQPAMNVISHFHHQIFLLSSGAWLKWWASVHHSSRPLIGSLLALSSLFHLRSGSFLPPAFDSFFWLDFITVVFRLSFICWQNCQSIELSLLYQWMISIFISSGKKMNIWDDMMTEFFSSWN